MLSFIQIHGKGRFDCYLVKQTTKKIFEQYQCGGITSASDKTQYFGSMPTWKAPEILQYTSIKALHFYSKIFLM